MQEKKKFNVTKLIIAIMVLFLVLSGIGLFLGSRYISGRLLQSNENTATDIALLVKNNFQITDAEVAYMKTLTFNEMEVDPINMRLMDVGNGVALNAAINNVYVLAPLSDSEIKYYTDEETSEFFGYEVNTPLNGIWLMNGKIGDDGKFIVAQRDDIYRYTSVTETERAAFEHREAFGTFSDDAWGSFITGYAPLYTVEGNFVGLLGIDMDPDKYQANAQAMIFIMFIAFAITAIAMVGIFIFFYFKYIKAKEGQLQFDFYSRMSHDMRTPMNGILGIAALSKDENDIDTLHKNFEKVENSGVYMLGLINDTLDLQRIEAGKLQLKPQVVYCKEVIENMTDMIEVAAAKKNIDFKVINKNSKLDCYAYVDEVRVKQIFMNLASNAIKFTPEGGKVEFVLETTSIQGDICHDKFQIIDNGVGMSEKFMQNNMFKPFEQEDNAMTSQYAGSGLGLAITKKLVSLMDGKIEVESKPGKGTTFTVYLDIKGLSDEKAENIIGEKIVHTQDAESVLRGKHILICEDQPLNAEITRRLVEKAGCTTEVAENGEIGLQLFEKSPGGTFDAVLMDIKMPVMDGLDATKNIRALERYDAKCVPIIAMTANAYDEDIKNSLKAGMNAHLAKPVKPDELYITLAENISKNPVK